MQKQQRFVSDESGRNHNIENTTKYQLLVSSGVYGQKPAVLEHQVTQPVSVTNQEVAIKCVSITAMYILQKFCGEDFKTFEGRFLCFSHNYFKCLA